MALKERNICQKIARKVHLHDLADTLYRKIMTVVYNVASSFRKSSLYLLLRGIIIKDFFLVREIHMEDNIIANAPLASTFLS